MLSTVFQLQKVFAANAPSRSLWSEPPMKLVLMLDALSASSLGGWYKQLSGLSSNSSSRSAKSSRALQAVWQLKGLVQGLCWSFGCPAAAMGSGEASTT
jgi:hypothetical protein